MDKNHISEHFWIFSYGGMTRWAADFLKIENFKLKEYFFILNFYFFLLKIEKIKYFLIKISIFIKSAACRLSRNVDVLAARQVIRFICGFFFVHN
jgi:aminopeptidase C